MSFLWTTLYVKDMEESLSFYQDILGLSIANRFQARPGVEIVFLGDGETKVELIWDQEKKNPSMGQDISLGFQVDSLADQLEFIKEKGIPILRGPIEPNPSTKFFFISDPNGLTIQFVELS